MADELMEQFGQVCAALEVLQARAQEIQQQAQPLLARKQQIMLQMQTRAQERAMSPAPEKEPKGTGKK